MNQTAQRHTFLDEHAWMIGEEMPAPDLSERARSLRDTRIAAVMFRQRARLLFAWRKQAYQREMERAQKASQIALIRLATTRRSTAEGEVAIVTDLPRHFPPLRAEIAIWRSHLAHEIHAILFGND